MQILLFVVVIAATSGCTSYSARERESLEFTSSAASAQRNGIAVSVEAYGDTEKQKAYFGEDLSSVGAIPVLVRFQNKGSQPFELPIEIQLRTPDGTVVKEVGATSIALLFTHESSMARGILYNSPFGWLFALGGMSSGAQAAGEAVDERIANYREKALKRGAIKPGESRQGFVYFVLGIKSAPLTQATVLLPLSNTLSRKGLEFVEVPITGLSVPSSSQQ